MTDEQKFYVGDDPLIRIDCVNSLSGAANPKILYQKPDGTEGSWVANIVSDRYLEYQTDDTEEEDIDQEGVWLFHSSVTFGGNEKVGNLTSIRIHARFEG
jgi:hypothetical protein